MKRNKETAMKKKLSKKIFLIVGIVVAIILLGLLFIFVFPFQNSKTAPVVIITSPSQGDKVALDELYAVHSSVRDDGQIIE